MKDKRNRISLILGILAVLLFTGCGLPGFGEDKPAETPQNTDTGHVLAGPGSYDSADTAVVVGMNKGDQTITFFNTTVNKNYTLSYDGTTTITDKYGQVLTLDQIKIGDMVDVTFLKTKKRLNSLALSAQVWKIEEVNRYSIDTSTSSITVGKDVYKLTKNTKILSDGEEIEIGNLDSVDILTLQGIGSSVHSIIVDKGHGYLSLTGDTLFIGGWIEIGQNMIYPITEGMRLTVPEGSYDVQISHKGGGGTKQVVINRNKDVTLDISNLEIKEAKYGNVTFVMTPSTARLYVDGKIVDTSAPVRLEYGIHQLVSMADGYQTITSYLKVGSASPTVEITLEQQVVVEEDEDSSSVSSSDAE